MRLKNRANLLPPALFHLVTDRASFLTVQSIPRLQFMGKNNHVVAICAQTSANSPVRVKSSSEN